MSVYNVDTSVSNQPQKNVISCYKCTSSLEDENNCEQFFVYNNECPLGTSQNPNGCAMAMGGNCPKINKTICYRCTSSLSDGNACEAFETSSQVCPIGSSSNSNGCALANGGQCPKIKTCYRCTQSVNDGNLCEPFQVEDINCPSNSSESPIGCAAAVGGACIHNPIICGPIDINNDNQITIIDISTFALYYGRFCSDSPFIPTSLPTCGGKDTNGDGKINKIDLDSINARLNLPNCYV
ncbi:MAG: hypothetical protein NZZ41_04320 [Candidatus Dojkabacteria bacterium]|nr:hypothetical protein [Candidatus Dojkabacteria bacterium]